ncbi:sugar transferase [bacterium 1xD42-62]|uniref:Sugar transferase n=2 Tax=Parablautia muri TaxID=2320879 RepID=A0A9X5BI54_9FIRM|nr:sugar transferase [Parablautia muri]
MYRFSKRAVDIIAAILGIILLSPIFLLTVAAILMEDGPGVIYTQERIGKNRKVFKIYKFRSMWKDADKLHEKLRKKYNNTEVSFKLTEDPRVTKTGKIIRKFNIDELPQLLNILAGDMSFVGPRPLPVYEYEEEQKRYGEKYIQRYSVPQGLTCYWQISDRAKQSFETRMQQDVDYAANCCISEDIKLMIKTLFFTICGKAKY